MSLANQRLGTNTPPWTTNKTRRCAHRIMSSNSHDTLFTSLCLSGRSYLFPGERWTNLRTILTLETSQSTTALRQTKWVEGKQRTVHAINLRTTPTSKNNSTYNTQANKQTKVIWRKTKRKGVHAINLRATATPEASQSRKNIQACEMCYTECTVSG